MVYQENLERYRKNYPAAAEKVASVDVSSFEFCKTRKGEENISYERGGKRVCLHSNYWAQKESDKWFSNLKLDKVKVLIVYGLGLAYAYESAKPWLEESVEHYLVFVEDDPRVLRRFFELSRAQEIIENTHQVLIALTEPGEEGRQEACNVISEYFVSLPFAISVLPHYEMYRQEEALAFQTALRHKFALVNYSSVEFRQYGRSYFTNFYHTLLFLGESHWGYKLFKKFSGVPAIICGAGPSLNKNGELLKTLEDRALIFAGGSAINALSRFGLQPHFGGSVDPNPLQQERMLQHSCHELPMFYKGRINYKAFHSLHGPRIYIPGSTSYPVTSWVERKLGLDVDTIREGCSVIHFLMELACFMGCNPIVMVGMDLAYSGNELYAGGVVDQAKVSEKTLTRGTHLNDHSFLRKDIHGNPVYTLWKWVAESDYAGGFIKQYPHLTFINATEGGLGLGEMPNEKLVDVIDEYLGEQYDLRQWVHAELQGSRFPNVDAGKVMKVLEELKKSLSDCVDLCDALHKDFESLKASAESQNLWSLQHMKVKIERDKRLLTEKEAYRQILYPLTTLQSVEFKRRIDEIEFDPKVSSEKEKLVDMCEENLREIEINKEGALANLRAIEKAVDEYESLGYGVLS